MESDLQSNHHNLLHHQQQQQMSSGLMRYRSAPSSYFANFLDSEDCEEFLNHRASSPETERIISRFFTTSGGGGGDGGVGGDSPSHSLIRQNSQPEINQQNQFMAPMKLEEETIQQQQSNYSSASQMMYQNNNQAPLTNQNNSGASGSAMDGSFRVASSMGMDRFPQMKMGGGSTSNLIRHSSSPAGLFSNINIENGYVTMRGMGNFGGGNGNTSGEASFSSTSRMKNQMNFASGPPSSSGLMSPISELGNKNLGPSSPDNENFGENRSSGSSFITGFPIGSWDDSALMTENFSGLKRARDDTLSGLNALENQSEGTGNRPPLLSHHLSLPKTSAEMAAMENLLQFQDSVPCKIRAKRGCATHPRSIAERVRRTRISERMRKLQELVPNMDKQTNTADMLDLAVDYIKDLQKEVKTLADNRAKCTCSSNQKL